METTKKRPITYGMYNILAKSCNCSPGYVKQVLARTRVPKTENAVKALLILEKYEAYNKFFNNNTNINPQTL